VEILVFLVKRRTRNTTNTTNTTKAQPLADAVKEESHIPSARSTMVASPKRLARPEDPESPKSRANKLAFVEIR
jgi:hypothetical protein